MIFLIFVPLIFLFVLSIIDIATYNKDNMPFPEVVPLLFILVGFIFNLPSSLILGVLGLILGLLFAASNYYYGLPDLEAIVGSAMFLESSFNVFIFSILVLLIGAIYKIWTKLFNKQKKEIPFLPVLFFSYLTTLCIIYFLM